MKLKLYTAIALILVLFISTISLANAQETGLQKLSSDLNRLFSTLFSTTCTEGAYRCSGSTIQICDLSSWTDIQACTEFGSSYTCYKQDNGEYGCADKNSWVDREKMTCQEIGGILCSSTTTCGNGGVSKNCKEVPDAQIKLGKEGCCVGGSCVSKTQCIKCSTGKVCFGGNHDNNCCTGECLAAPTNPYCGDGTCNNGETCGSCKDDCGVCETPDTGQPSTPDNSQYIQVSSIILPSVNKALSGPEIAETFQVTLKNTDVNERTVKVEAGFYTQAYAQNVAKLFSVFPFFATVEPTANCVPTEPFVKTISVTLKPNEKKTVSISVFPYTAYLTLPVSNTPYVLSQTKLVSFLGVLAGECCKKTANFEGCAAGTGGYIESKYDPNYYATEGVKFTSKTITCNGEPYGKIKYSTFGEDSVQITRNYKECIKYDFYLENGTVDVQANEEYQEALANAGDSFEKIKKYSLTKNEIKTFPIQDLLASSCLSSSECLARDNYSVSCIRMNRLKEEGLIGDSEIKDITDKAKYSIGGSAVGAGTALTVCAVTGAVTGGAGFIACGIGGALLGAAGGYGISEITGNIGNIFNKEDALTKAIKSGDSTQYGICTAEESSFCKYTQWAALFKITGDKCNDGLIIIIGGVFILIFLLSLMSKP